MSIEDSKTKDKNVSITEEHKVKNIQLSNDLESIENENVGVQTNKP